MAKLQLEFISPNVLNNLKFGQVAEKSVWRYSGLPESNLFIDTDSWLIATADNAKSALISEWCVNEETKELCLKSETQGEGFKAIDYVFAMAMLGQLTDREGLIKYLGSLQEAFDGIKTPQPDSNIPEESDKESNIDSENTND